jgi:hypothetical protein
MRSEDGTLAFTPTVYDGLGNVTEDGKLKASFIDVNNLVARQAESPNFAAGSTGWQLNADGSAELQDAVVRGHIKMDTGYIADSVSIGGLGNFAYKNSLFYNEVSGTKPPDNADKTSSNTSNDTDNVAGRNATTVKDEAINGNDYVNYWKRPEDVTTIDGNKIFTGDAYVDTLQIKGRAVTFLQAQSGGSGTGTVISFSFNHQGDSAEDTLITFGGVLRSGDSGTYTSLFAPVFADLRINGSTVKTTIKPPREGRDHVVLSTVISIQSGNNTVSMVVRGDYGPDSQDCYVSAVACKR